MFIMGLIFEPGFMSWLVSLLKLSSDIVSIDDLTDEAQVQPLGTNVEVFSLVQELFPGADVSDPTWVGVSWQGYPFEIILNRDEPVFSIGLRSPSIEAITHICQHTGWRAYDTSSGGFMSFGEVTED